MAHQVQVHLHVVQAKVRRSYALRSNPDTGEFFRNPPEISFDNPDTGEFT